MSGSLYTRGWRRCFPLDSLKREVAKIYDEIAEGFDHTRGRPWPEVGLVDRGPVLDLGCGNGRHASYLEEEGYEVVCADISWGMLMVAGRRASNLVQCDAAKLPFRSNSFGTVLYLATIHHLPKGDRLLSLREVRRVLRPGGRLIISAWALFQPRFFKKIPYMLLNPLRGKEIGDTEVPWHRRGKVYHRYYHLFTRRELEGLVSRAGLKVISSYGRSFKYRLFSENHVVIAVKV